MPTAPRKPLSALPIVLTLLAAAFAGVLIASFFPLLPAPVFFVVATVIAVAVWIRSGAKRQ